MLLHVARSVRDFPACLKSTMGAFMLVVPSFSSCAVVGELQHPLKHVIVCAHRVCTSGVLQVACCVARPPARQATDVDAPWIP
jgi:hypothetical protein